MLQVARTAHSVADAVVLVSSSEEHGQDVNYNQCERTMQGEWCVGPGKKKLTLDIHVENIECDEEVTVQSELFGRRRSGDTVPTLEQLREFFAQAQLDPSTLLMRGEHDQTALSKAEDPDDVEEVLKWAFGSVIDECVCKMPFEYQSPLGVSFGFSNEDIYPLLGLPW